MGYNILLVDDDRNIRELFQTYFSEFYDVTAVASGPEALEILRKPNEIDVVVLDVVLPGLRGTEVLKEIKKIDPKIGIIMSTAYSSKDVAVAALKGHADDYVEKPLNVTKIRESIERLLQVKEGRHDLSACDIASKVDKVRRFTERNCDKKVSL